MAKMIEFIKFSLIGGIMTVLSLALFALFIETFNINYIISNILSYTIAVIISFYLHKIYTFQQKSINKKQDFIKLVEFFLMKLVLLGLDTILLYLMVEILQLNTYFSKIFLTLFLFIVSYPISKIIIKRKEKGKL